MRRVIQFSTGNVGRHSLRAIIGRPDLELVGVHAASAEKIGRDPAQLCGLDQSTGIIATDERRRPGRPRRDCVVFLYVSRRDEADGGDRSDGQVPGGWHQRRWYVYGLAGHNLATPKDWLRVPLEQAAAGIPRSTSMASTRASLPTRWCILQLADDPRLFDHGAGDFRLRKLRCCRVHGCRNGFRNDGGG